jgi:hypothetical protein
MVNRPYLAARRSVLQASQRLDTLLHGEETAWVGELALGHDGYLESTWRWNL